MKGVMLIFRPGGGEPEVLRFDRAPDLGDLKSAVGGGWIEKVPGFDLIEHDGKRRRCVALVDEEGKLDWRTSGVDRHQPDEINTRATVEWGKALVWQGHPGLITFGGQLADYLVGQVAVLYGDAEFMESL